MNISTTDIFIILFSYSHFIAYVYQLTDYLGNSKYPPTLSISFTKIVGIPKAIKGNATCNLDVIASFVFCLYRITVFVPLLTF